MTLARVLTVSLLLSTSAWAKAPDCPAAVKAAADKAYPKSTLGTCAAEGDHYEVKLTKADGAAIELDIKADGTLLQIEEVVALDKVPAAVMKAFGAKYPKAKPSRAEKQTHVADKRVSYELAFEVDGRKREATFAEDGHFVEEE